MKRLVIVIIGILIFIPVKVNAFETSATSAILMDQDSKRILYSKNIHTVRSIASISKIMTAILALESGKLQNVITIGDEIKTATGSAIYIKEGEHIKLEDLVYGLMLRSGNDAALAIAKAVSGSVDKFVELMNEKAIEIGMKNTNFNNPHGLDEPKSNYSTAYDMAILTSYAMKNKTYQKIVKTKKHVVKTDMNVYSWTNKNKLLTIYKYTTGGKTGYTEIAKRTLVSTATKDNLNLVAVTLNDGNDFADHKNLYEEAFETYNAYEILTKGNINIYDEKYYKDYQLYIKNKFSYPINEVEKVNIMLKFELYKKRFFSNNDQVGIVKVMIDDKVVHTENVYINKEKKDKRKNIITRIVGWFKGLW